MQNFREFHKNMLTAQVGLHALRAFRKFVSSLHGGGNSNSTGEWTCEWTAGSDDVRSARRRSIIITVSRYSTPHQSNRGGQWALPGGRGQHVDCHLIVGRVSS